MQHHLYSLRCSRVILLNVFRLHGCPDTFVMDRDPRWKSSFWAHWFSLLGIQTNMSTAYHPQTDGQTERTFRTLEEVLHHYIDPSHSSWESFLPWVELSVNSSIQLSPSKQHHSYSTMDGESSSPFDLGLPDIHQHVGQPFRSGSHPGSGTQHRLVLLRQGNACNQHKIGTSTLLTPNVDLSPSLWASWYCCQVKTSELLPQEHQSYFPATLGF
jgi:transposase InsO family protein